MDVPEPRLTLERPGLREREKEKEKGYPVHIHLSPLHREFLLLTFPSPLVRHYSDNDTHHTRQSNGEIREGEGSRQVRTVSKAHFEETKGKGKWASVSPSTPSPFTNIRHFRHQTLTRTNVLALLSLSPR